MGMAMGMGMLMLMGMVTANIEVHCRGRLEPLASELCPGSTERLPNCKGDGRDRKHWYEPHLQGLHEEIQHCQ